jgi:dTDP-4-dehydrorhamnose reductase
MPPDSQATVLVTGATGKLGGFLWRHLSLTTEAWGTARTGPAHPQERFVSCDLTDAEAVKQMFAVIKPQICIHCAAIADPDLCERIPSLCHAINVQATGNVSKAAQERASRLIFCSTDYVFGNEKLTYSESDETSPLQEYGRSKVLAERLVLQTQRSAVLRLPLLYGASQKCLVAQVRAAALNRSEFRAEGATLRYPLFIPDVASVVQRLVMTPEHDGIFHLSGPEATTKLEWARLTAQLCPQRTVSIRPSLDGATSTAERPVSIRLDDRKARDLLSFSPRSVAQGSRAALKMLNEKERSHAF